MMSQFLNGDQLEALLKRLQSLSARGKLTWKEEAGGHFATTVGDFYYRLWSADFDDYAPYRFQVHRKNAGVDAPLVNVFTDGDDEWAPVVYVSVGDLFDLVRRKVLGLDELAADLFEALDELDDLSP